MSEVLKLLQMINELGKKEKPPISWGQNQMRTKLRNQFLYYYNRGYPETKQSSKYPSLHSVFLFLTSRKSAGKRVRVSKELSPEESLVMESKQLFLAHEKTVRSHYNLDKKAKMKKTWVKEQLKFFGIIFLFFFLFISH